jgi:hypothetical protein
MSKADDLIKSIAPAQLAKARTKVREELGYEEDTKEIRRKTDKLDLAIDIQLMMTGKFRHALALIWITMGIAIVALAVQVLGQSRQLSMQGQITAITESQKEMIEEQKKANIEAKKSTIAVDAVTVEVKKTKEQMQEAVEAAPKLEVDPESGRTKVVIPIKRPKDGKSDKKNLKDPVTLPTPTPPTQIELRDDF